MKSIQHYKTHYDKPSLPSSRVTTWVMATNIQRCFNLLGVSWLDIRHYIPLTGTMVTVNSDTVTNSFWAAECSSTCAHVWRYVTKNRDVTNRGDIKRKPTRDPYVKGAVFRILQCIKYALLLIQSKLITRCTCENNQGNNESLCYGVSWKVGTEVGTKLDCSLGSSIWVYHVKISCVLLE